MNCQVFRSKWPDETDSELLAHVETCDACIAWIESTMMGDEEVQFLKEIPSPPADLEERIMQAIYQNAGVTFPPHAAATDRLSETARAVSAGKRRQTRLPLAWAGAAAILLATGLVGFQQWLSPEGYVAQESGSVANVGEKGEEKTEALLAQEDSSKPARSHTASSKPVTIGEGESPEAENGSAITAKDDAPSPARQEAPAQSAAAEVMGPTLSEASPAAAHASNGASQAAENPAPAGEIAAASAAREEVLTIAPYSGSSNTEAAANQEAGPAAEDAASSSSTTVAKHPVTPGVTSDFAQEPNVFALTLVPDAKTEASHSLANAEEFHVMAGPPAPMEIAGITLSTFLDAETAAQASDLPVPVLSQLPGGFALGEITVRYESETSHKVRAVRADYTRSADWVRIEVERNHNSKRSLAIPGTFSATLPFVVNDEKAIGVTFETPEPGTGAQHAVHFNADVNGQSLYVVLTARGIALEELIEAAKRITWKF